MIREFPREHEVRHEAVVAAPTAVDLGRSASARIRWTFQASGDQVREALLLVKRRQLAAGVRVMNGPVRLQDVARQCQIDSWQRVRSMPHSPLRDVRHDFVSSDSETSAAHDDAAREFRVLADRWRAETAALPTMQQKAIHPAYQRIIGMGSTAIPMILRELKERGGHWYWALRFITAADPVPDADRGRVAAMREHWLEWGRSAGYLART